MAECVGKGKQKMLFNSLNYAIFLPIVFILFWILPHKFRWVLLLISSYYFYMSWNVEYVVLILFTTIISYVCSRFLEKTEKDYLKKMYLIFTLLASLGVLFFFKYFNFFADNICNLLNYIAIPVHPITLNVLLPVGISFYTFQTLSYVIDVYRGKVKPVHHFGVYATYISFFPQLVAGPIERTNNLLPQIIKEHRFDYKKASYGLKLMAWGFFKKIAIADTLAIYVDRIYKDVNHYEGAVLIIASVMFAIQIYCDFSGYSDIAIGTAKLFDIDLMKNFKSPYFSTTIKQFWSKWHISLSTWFKDYVYIPLGGNRKGSKRRAFNLVVTFLVSGLWHGANWTYVVWGAIHGIAQIIENGLKGLLKKRTISKGENKVKYWCSVTGVFAFCTLGWIFFRATSLNDAFYVFQSMFTGISNPIKYVVDGLYALEISRLDLLNVCVMIGILFVYDFYDTKIDVIEKIGTLKLPVRWSIYIACVLLILVFAPIKSGGEFIYFQF